MVEYSQTEHLMRTIVKSVIKKVQNYESEINEQAHHTIF